MTQALLSHAVLIIRYRKEKSVGVIGDFIEVFIYVRCNHEVRSAPEQPVVVNATARPNQADPPPSLCVFTQHNVSPNAFLSFFCVFNYLLSDGV